MAVSAPFVFSFWSVDYSNGDKQTSTAVLLIFVFVFALLWLRPKFRRPSLPPGPRGLPLVGYLPFLSGNLHHTFADLAQIYGPIFKLRLGTKLCVVLSSPSSVNEALHHQETVLDNRDSTISALLATYGGADILFSQDEGDWKKLRKIFTRKMLSKSNLDASYSLRRKEVRKVIKGAFESAGSPINIGKLGFFATVKSVMAMTWGGSGGLIGMDEADLEAKFREVVDELMILVGTPNLSDLFPVLGRFDLQGIARKMKKVMNVFYEILNSAIEEQRKMGGHGVERRGFLQCLLEFKDSEDSSESITDNQLKGLLMDIIIGGTDTTATTIEWAIAELMQQPNTMKKVVEELTKVVGLNQMVEDFHLSKLHYLDAVVKETLRLHPPLSLLVPRTATQTIILGGYTIPKNSAIYFNIWAIQRDPKVWDNPLNFWPERFLNEFTRNAYDFTGNNIKFCPFGSGKKVCAGIPLAERLLVLILASLLHAFEWELPEGSKLDSEETFGIVTRKLNPLVAIPIPRLSNLELYNIM
ncbi:labd-13Z-ene-9,15,16-triol synthase, chloroplastic-like [Benincasa hispida]|uniref:labd-13Z-ene-9,15,16-triol synthase, chloroplastic-like n=1 Tax=Benincasa hispida TaxID=102211 RepID=UPI00190249E1|nr:labd-13Z-ene-9,15,16-triol synthase, chloroplastic-like [Benincasa hispida]